MAILFQYTAPYSFSPSLPRVKLTVAINIFVQEIDKEGREGGTEGGTERRRDKGEGRHVGRKEEMSG